LNLYASADTHNLGKGIEGRKWLLLHELLHARSQPDFQLSSKYSSN